MVVDPVKLKRLTRYRPADVLKIRAIKAERIVLLF